MRKSKKIFLGVVVGVLIIAVALSVFGSYFAKLFFQKTSTYLFQEEVSFKNLYYLPPLGLKASEITWGENAFFAQSVRMQINVLSLLKGRPEADYLDIIRPVINIEEMSHLIPQSKVSSSRAPSTMEPSDQAKEVPMPSETILTQPAHRSFSIHKLRLREGRFIYNDTARDGQYAFSLDHVSLQAEPIILPQSPLSKFSLTARIAESNFPLASKVLTAGGWADFVHNNMNAAFKLSTSESQPGFVINVISKNNEMKVVGNGSIENLLSTFPQNNAEADVLSGAFASLGMNINAGFSFTTKMNDFRIPDSISVFGQVIQKE